MDSIMMLVVDPRTHAQPFMEPATENLQGESLRLSITVPHHRCDSCCVARR